VGLGWRRTTAREQEVFGPRAGDEGLGGGPPYPIPSRLQDPAKLPLNDLSGVGGQSLNSSVVEHVCRCAAAGETRQCEVGRRVVITIVINRYSQEVAINNIIIIEPLDNTAAGCASSY
jgi:hypothetical protein